MERVETRLELFTQLWIGEYGAKQLYASIFFQNVMTQGALVLDHIKLTIKDINKWSELER